MPNSKTMQREIWKSFIDNLNIEHQLRVVHNDQRHISLLNHLSAKVCLLN